MRAFALFAALAAPLASAQEHPSEFVYSAPIAAQAGASHYRLTLPSQAYRGAARRDLGDLRIFNAGAEPVPYAFMQRDLQRPPPTVQAVKLFPLYGDEAKGLDATSVRVERNARGTLVSVSVNEKSAPPRRRLLGYLLDPGEMKQPMDALMLEWDSAEGFTGHARVEGSEDLKHWHTVTAGAPILSLQHAGASLERSRIELSGGTSRYLRLSLSGVPRSFKLKQIRLELRPAMPQPSREWLVLAGAPGKGGGEWIFDTEGHFPVDRMRLHLPQLNTVARVQLQTRSRVDDNWRPVTSAIAYRLAGEAGEVVNPDIVFPSSADRYWLLKVDQKGGGLGAGQVRLEVGWLPHELVFAARGAAPFTLAYGNSKSKPGALAIGTVLPQKPDGAAPLPQPATLGAISGSAGPPPSLFSEPLRFVRHLAERRDVKTWALWGALVAGVLVLAWMAFRLLRDVGSEP